MMFSEEKCKVMHIGRRNKEFVYTINGKQLQVISNEKDLEVMMTNDLKTLSNVSKHTTEPAGCLAC